ncbi:efflux RND transporter periplasmic adaptor subunit [Brevundimonas goettingensis]|uniref:Efflux RND transporter periplasmic adaptor subunit n=2 Tax=Brevundimonas goettingensis TaxID=2774190 RepID=A0A975C955_9CAUL|nr:efflux RND transporter periplasmic adaptor subunit [Brevundimonas goettingensis]
MTRTRSAFAGAALISTLALLAACGGGKEDAAKKAQQEQAAAGQTVTAATATQTSLRRKVSASGSVSAWEEVPVGAETGGLTAVGLYVDEGSYVRQGQPLVQMNDVLLRAQLRQQQAAVQTAEANVARDDAALSRAQQLKEKGFLSQASLDTALANQRASAANLASARAALSETQTRVNQATIRAPVSGLIISRSVTKGQIISAGTELFRMVRDGRLELDAQVPETELPLVRAGQGAVVTSEQANGPVNGSVRIVTPQVDAQTRLGIARVTLSPGSGLRPGMFARAEIDVGDAPALTIPASAVVFREGKPGVYLIAANNTVRFTPVITGERSGQTVVIASGLQPGARVVVQGAGFLGDGDHVTVSTAPAPAPAAPTAR